MADRSIQKAIEKMVKNSDKIVIGIILIALPFLFAFFWNNFTASAIGVTMIGVAATLKIMIDGKRQSKAIWYMWIALIIIDTFLLGIEYILPKLTFN